MAAHHDRSSTRRRLRTAAGRRVHRPSAPPVDAVRRGVLGTLRVLRDASAARGVRGDRVLRRAARGRSEGTGQPDVRRLHGPDLWDRHLRRLRRRPLSRLPSVDPARRHADGGGPVPAAGSRPELVPGRPRRHRRRQWTVQAEHLDHGRQAVRAHRPAPRFGIHDLLHGHQCRRRAGAARLRSPDRRALRLPVGLLRGRARHDRWSRRVPLADGLAGPHRHRTGSGRERGARAQGAVGVPGAGACGLPDAEPGEDRRLPAAGAVRGALDLFRRVWCGWRPRAAAPLHRDAAAVPGQDPVLGHVRAGRFIAQFLRSGTTSSRLSTSPCSSPPIRYSSC